MIGNRTAVDHFDNVEWSTCIEHHRLADIFKRQPDLIAVRSRSDVGAERALLLHVPDDLMPAAVMTTVSGVKLEQTYPYLPSGEKIVMPGPFGTVIRVFSLKVLPSRIAT